MISVIICSHNPRGEYLRRTLDALRSQSLSFDQWELILVDNASAELLDGKWDLSWHPNGMHVREEELGLTSARLRGIHEAECNLLIFVDDDNLLAPDYLEKALRISVSHPFLGAWGGSCVAEYEKTPPTWFLDYEGNVAVRKVERIIWSNQYFDYRATPIGAGMCVRKTVAETYSDRLRTDVHSRSLDRKGSSLMSCGDHDIAWTSIAMGLGVGVFPSLELTHIIPEFRVQKKYILKLLEADACSTTIMRANLLGEKPHLESWGWRTKTKDLIRKVKRMILFRERDFRDEVASAIQVGKFRAYQMLSKPY